MGVDGDTTIWAEMKRWLNNFPHKQYRRCRFMLLEPDGHITAHNDQNNTGRRNIKSGINLAITQPEGCYLKKSRYEKKNYLLNLVQSIGLTMVLNMKHIMVLRKIVFILLYMVETIQERGDLMLYALKELVGNDVEKDFRSSDMRIAELVRELTMRLIVF